MTRPLIRGELYKTYGDAMKVVFRHAPITVMEDEICLLVGRNGSGKTTLLKILARVEENHLDSLEWSVSPDAVSYMPPTLACYSHMNVQNLLLFHETTNPSFDAGLARDHLRSFSIDPSMRVARLSDGQKKILSYVICLSVDARLYLIDEPFPNVDLVFDETFRKMILSRADGTRSFVIATHQISQFETVAGRVLFITGPKTVQSLDVEEIRTTHGMSVEAYIKSEMKRISS
jgi:ABC-2 type transport system ATP-binding protein